MPYKGDKGDKSAARPPEGSLVETRCLIKGPKSAIVPFPGPRSGPKSRTGPGALIVDQKQQSVDDSGRCLQLFQRKKKEFLRKYVTMDETWIHHFISNWHSAEWIATSETRPSDQTPSSDVMASVFWDSQGILFIDYLEKGRTFYSEYYIASLVRLKEEIAKKTAINEEEKSALSPR